MTTFHPSAGGRYATLAGRTPDRPTLPRMLPIIRRLMSKLTPGRTPQPTAHTMLHTLAANVPHRIYAKDIEGRFIFANRSVANGMGVASADHLLGKTDFDFYPEEDARQYWAKELEILKSGHPMLSQEEHVEYLLVDRKAWLLTTKVPLRDDKGRVIGLVGINYDITPLKDTEQALREAKQEAEVATRQLAITVDKLNGEVQERERMEEQLRRQALHDALTGLPNRALLIDRLEHAIQLAQRSKQPLTVLFINLDRFKIVNDSLGHGAGDELLKTVTQRVAACVRGCDTFARLGSDEFVLLLQDEMAGDKLEYLIGRIAAAVATPMQFGEREVTVTCSIGCSVYPQDGDDAPTLLKHADAAMNLAKEQGRNNVQRYHAELNRNANDQLEMESQLRRAIERGQLMLHYQPQVDLRTGEVVGVEALVRWPHPEWGMVPPLRFIPIAEESGLIGPLGRWVLRTACAQAVAWRQQGLPAQRMSVNLSAKQFLNPGLESEVVSALSDTGLPANMLELELTESVSMKDPEETIRILARFHALGIGLAIDDFGTGYSNLAYLKRFPLHRIKLDRSFIKDIGIDESSEVIAEAMIAMAHKLQLQVVAEGVETLPQRDLLAALGCDLMQGYWFSKPVDADALATLLANQHRRIERSSVDLVKT